MSRAGDSQLHTHVVVGNLTCGAGRYTALDARPLYEHKSAGRRCTGRCFARRSGGGCPGLPGGAPAAGIVIGDPELHHRISAMKDYLDALGREYKARYLPVGRQQRLDELWLSDRMKAANTGEGTPALPELLEQPTEAWRQLENRARFPRLARLLRQDVFRIDVFRASYKLAKGHLEMHSGFRDRPIEAAIPSADKLLERTSEFMSSHRDIPAELRTRISDRAHELEQARSQKDRAAIDAATLRLNDVTAEAVNASTSNRTTSPHRNGMRASPHRNGMRASRRTGIDGRERLAAVGPTQ
jgi:hypothetical protein